MTILPIYGKIIWSCQSLGEVQAQFISERWRDQMASTILYKTLIMLILIGVGVLCAKTKLISEASNKDLSKFVLQVVNPVVIFMSYQTEYRVELVKNLLLTFVISAAVLCAVILLSYVFVRSKQDRETEIERFSAVYSNCGFMGIPLVDAIYHEEGVFYLTAFITVFNLIVWTHGVILISGQKDFKQVVKVFREILYNLFVFLSFDILYNHLVTSDSNEKARINKRMLQLERR